MVADVEMVKLQHEVAIDEKLLVLWSAVPAGRTEHVLVPPAGRGDIGNGDQRLRANGHARTVIGPWHVALGRIGPGILATVTAILFVVAALVAVGDWLAVWQRFFRIEYLLKPLTLALLVAAAASADLPGDVKPWVLAALVLGLVGDVALMLSNDDAGKLDGPFLIGLGAFLAGHVCYLAAYARYGLGGLQMLAGLLVVVGTAALTLPRILSRAKTVGGQELMAVVGAYAAVLGAMAVLAVGTKSVLTAIGGLLFLGSDTVLAWERFVKPIRGGPVIVIVSYHLAQALIVLGLIAGS
jgi:uncharacterized membrane protein YhhN